MGTKKKIEPKTETKKVDGSDGKDKKATKKAERKTQRAQWSDAGVKHAVTALG